MADSAYRDRVAQIFTAAPFIQDLGILLVDCGPGWVESEMTPQPRHCQQNGFFHAGVVSTIADHTAGAAAGTLAPPDRYVLTAEYKINLLRPGTGEKLVCRADVIKPGKSLTVVESSVFGVEGDTRKLLAKAMLTMALVS